MQGNGTEMKKRFVVLDRDGTINVEREYLSDPARVELLPGAIEGLRHFHALGLGLVVITNQAGVGRGFFDLDRLDQIHTRLSELLKVEGVVLDGIYFCPHHPDDGCTCRKPQPELLLRAARDHDFIPAESFVIGDKLVDINLGKNVNATTLLVRTGYGDGVSKQQPAIWDYVVDDLRDAANLIEGLLNTK
mgnify:CR=1 FL=1